MGPRVGIAPPDSPPRAADRGLLALSHQRAANDDPDRLAPPYRLTTEFIRKALSLPINRLKQLPREANLHERRLIANAPALGSF